MSAYFFLQILSHFPFGLYFSSNIFSFWFLANIFKQFFKLNCKKVFNFRVDEKWNFFSRRLFPQHYFFLFTIMTFINSQTNRIRAMFFCVLQPYTKSFYVAVKFQCLFYPFLLLNLGINLSTAGSLRSNIKL